MISRQLQPTREICLLKVKFGFFADLPGFTRSVYERDHALITPESHVFSPLPDWYFTIFTFPFFFFFKESLTLLSDILIWVIWQGKYIGSIFNHTCNGFAFCDVSSKNARSDPISVVNSIGIKVHDWIWCCLSFAENSRSGLPPDDVERCGIFVCPFVLFVNFSEVEMTQI